MTMEQEQNDWGKSVGGIVLRGQDVLLVRHTYGPGKGRLIIPGGYVHQGEAPEDAARREVMEETSVQAEVCALAGLRFNTKDWYAVFLMRYIAGTPRSDRHENSEALFMPIEDAIASDEVPDLTRKLLTGLLRHGDGVMPQVPFHSNAGNAPYSLYTIPQDI